MRRKSNPPPVPTTRPVPTPRVSMTPAEMHYARRSEPLR